jgi:hypothetical protein
MAFVIHAARLCAQSNPGQVPSTTLTAGAGNVTGWLGIQAERYFARGRRSPFVGVGYTPSRNADDPTGLAFAAGVRGFTGGPNHRAFAELSFSQLRRVRLVPGISPGKRLYGPGLEGGYQFISSRGVTVMGSLGLGYAIAAPVDVSAFVPMAGVSFGYTWRH